MRTWSLLAIAMTLAACPGGSPPKHAVTAPPPPPAPAPSAPAAPAIPDPYAELNLGFEDVERDQPKGWTLPSPGYEARAVGDEHHGGGRSLRLRSTGGGEFGTAVVRLDARPLVGKRLRIHGWIKTADAVAGAALWVRIDGGSGAFDNMNDRRVTGTAPWTEAVAEVDVPAGAGAAVFGAMLIGTGTAWFDDLRIEVVAVEPPHPIVVAGTVVDSTGTPAAGAEVALIGTELAGHVQTDAGGRFQFETRSGRWGFSAHRTGAVGAFVDQRAFTGDVRDLRIALGKDGGVTVRGRTTPRAPADGYVEISMISNHDADLFAVPVAPDGTFEVVLPHGDQYIVTTLDGGSSTARPFQRTGDHVDVTLPLAVLAPPPPEVVDYIAGHAIPLASAEAGHGFADLGPLGKLVGNARIVALGEATHGTREFFQLKHRVLEYLVAKQGFTVFAIEANQPECRAINDYVVAGKGTARAALDGIYFWTWNTEEVLAMIEWMRAWNVDPKHPAKLSFVGYDMQTAVVAYKTVEAFLRAAAPAQVDALVAPIAVLGSPAARETLGKASADDRAKLAAGLAEVAKAFDANRKAWTAAAAATPFADVRHDVTVLEQATRLYTAGDQGATGFDIRDRSMADNIAWLLDQQPAARMVVWAHNAHIANTLAAFANMGGHLRKQLGKRYVNLGFVFGEGSFQAIDFNAASRKLAEFTVGPPPESNASVAFSRTGKPLLVLDLRALPRKGPVHDWFTTAHPIREIGAVFASEKSMTQPLVLTDLYDAVIFIDKTTRARPLAKP